MRGPLVRSARPRVEYTGQPNRTRGRALRLIVWAPVPCRVDAAVSGGGDKGIGEIDIAKALREARPPARKSRLPCWRCPTSNPAIASIDRLLRRRRVMPMSLGEAFLLPEHLAGGVSGICGWATLLRPTSKMKMVRRIGRSTTSTQSASSACHRAGRAASRQSSGRVGFCRCVQRPHSRNNETKHSLLKRVFRLFRYAVL